MPKFDMNASLADRLDSVLSAATTTGSQETRNDQLEMTLATIKTIIQTMNASLSLSDAEQRQTIDKAQQVVAAPTNDSLSLEAMPNVLSIQNQLRQALANLTLEV